MPQHFTPSVMSMKTRLISASAVFLLVFPIAAGAKSMTGIVDTAAETVTRANFLSWSFQALEIPKGDGACSLPYTRVPRGLKATLCAAKMQGALDVFGTGKRYPLNAPITRGEAIIVLTALTDYQDTEDTSAFRDVKTDEQKQAVANALVRKWMVPASATIFGLEKQLTGSETLILLNAAGTSASRQSVTITLNNSNNQTSRLPREDLMLAVWDLLKRDYLKQEKISEDEAAYRAIEGMVNSLSDPYTVFFRPAGASDFQSQIKGEISGIGATIEDVEGIITVIAPLPNSPAERAGIQTKDEILEANGHVLKGLGVEKAVGFIRGEKGTSVVLKIRRRGVEMTITVVRDTITIPEISVSWQGDIAVVQLAQFGETTEKKIRSNFADIAKKNPKGIILDLRNNGGGLLNAADIVVSNFVPRGSVVAKVNARSSSTEEKTQDEPTVDSATRVVVLVNKGSASASEITAGALQDYKRATIVGVVTYGKGTVQEIVGFTSGEAFKLTIAEWLTPLGRHIDGVGITPDIVVEAAEGRDEQMKRALDILR
jgi:carboxyl-terminal processing protease